MHSGFGTAWDYSCDNNRECDRIAKERGFDDAEDGDINELFKSHGKMLSVEDSEEVAEQLSKQYTDESEADSALWVRTLAVKST